ncbi:MAG: ATP-binding protein [Leptospiraceae bacterium]|nr:ATP-binding protein [Leptospiraceae bacterium]
MTQNLSDTKILGILKGLLPYGLTGYVDDFHSWVKMELKKSEVDFSDLTKEKIEELLNQLKSSGDMRPGEFDTKEFTPAEKFLTEQKDWQEDSYDVLGAFEFSPIQYVRSRLEFFLKANDVNEMDLMDISIATIEGIENAAKYGDGGYVSINLKLSSDKKLTISITNNIKEFDLENEIERGKYSATTTLMRGIMVMQKLFNHLDLQILDDKRQAKLYAEKQLTS